MAGFYAQVILYSVAWRQIAQAAGDDLPFPGAPVEWTADQRLLWALQGEYRSVAQAVAMREGDLPPAEILESPEALWDWFDEWLKLKRDTGGADKTNEHTIIIQ